MAAAAVAPELLPTAVLLRCGSNTNAPPWGMIGSSPSPWKDTQQPVWLSLTRSELEKKGKNSC